MEAAVTDDHMTVAEFHQLEFDDNDPFLYELLTGELVKKKVLSPRHQLLLAELYDQVKAHVKASQAGTVLFAPVDVFLSDYDAPQPDLVFVEKAKANFITHDGVMGVPTLVVEVISPSSVFRDRVTKKQLYQQHGIQEYWLIEPADNFIEIFTLVDGRYDLLSAASPQEGTLNSGVLPGLTLNLKTLFGETESKS
ncbi:Uma2 family endonuclease [Rudanella paleaurantiibacter]|uniref:Uma2 family endonuclease n=1 Tax=Rudanella paleaurantiibacter TaxID=2614655 RepID=A0A7J5U5R1_9BACT|nr:Uma2 family endonuclease [Rudanella paleaurantiibacter]KAB7733116.1 Uma2 family endonuclease [Rudanella paleaurantiibacter]